MGTSMTRRAFVGTTGICGLTLAACGASEDTAADATTDTTADAGTTEAKDGLTIKGTYKKHVEGFDWGCGVSHATIELEAPLDAVSETDFTVTETKMATDFTDETFPINEVTIPRTVTGPRNWTRRASSSSSTSPAPPTTATRLWCSACTRSTTPGATPTT